MLIMFMYCIGIYNQFVVLPVSCVQLQSRETSVIGALGCIFVQNITKEGFQYKPLLFFLFWDLDFIHFLEIFIARSGGRSWGLRAQSRHQMGFNIFWFSLFMNTTQGFQVFMQKYSWIPLKITKKWMKSRSQNKKNKSGIALL